MKVVIPAKAGIQIENTGFRIKSGMTKCVKFFLRQYTAMKRAFVKWECLFLFFCDLIHHLLLEFLKPLSLRQRDMVEYKGSVQEFMKFLLQISDFRFQSGNGKKFFPL